MTYQAISVTWDDDTQSVILIQFPHSWDIDDFIQAFDIAHSMMAEVEHTVHLISVLPRQFTIPPRLLLNLPAIFESIPVNSGTHFVIGGGMITKTLLGVARRIGKVTDASKFQQASLLPVINQVNRVDKHTQQPGVQADLQAQL